MRASAQSVRNYTSSDLDPTGMTHRGTTRSDELPTYGSIRMGLTLSAMDPLMLEVAPVRSTNILYPLGGV